MWTNSCSDAPKLIIITLAKFIRELIQHVLLRVHQTWKKIYKHISVRSIKWQIWFGFTILYSMTRNLFVISSFLWIAIKQLNYDYQLHRYIMQMETCKMCMECSYRANSYWYKIIYMYLEKCFLRNVKEQWWTHYNSCWNLPLQIRLIQSFYF